MIYGGRLSDRKSRFGSTLNKRVLVNLAVFLLVLYVILPQIGRFKSSIHLLENLRLATLILAISLSCMTYLFAGSMYVILAQRKIRLFKTVLVQIAGTFVNRLVPAGAGAISVNYEYLRANKHSNTQAAAVITANNSLGLIGHLLLLAVLSFASPASFRILSLPHISKLDILIVSIFIVLTALYVWRRNFERTIAKFIKGVSRNLYSYSHHVWRVVTALICSMSLTLCYSLCLWTCARCLKIDLDLTQSVVALTVGVAAGTVIPTPGGLGAVEAGIAGGLFAVGVSGPDSLAITLLYRLITYWFSLTLGGVALFLTEKLGYI